MKYLKYLRGPAIALLAFLFGVAVSPIHFEVEGRGCGRMIDTGRGFSITSYRSSYFVQLTFAHAGHESSEKANAMFDDHLDEAIQVLDVRPRLDDQRKTIGQRGVAIFLDKETNKQFASVFWTQGQLFHAITSTSLLHVLEFEKQNVVD
jgi:hypothetical protein